MPKHYLFRSEWRLRAAPDDVYAALKGAGATLCLSEREDNAPPPLVETAPWGYVRLRLETYGDDELRAWSTRLSATSWNTIAKSRHRAS